MSSLLVDNLVNPWQPDPTGLWTAAASAEAAHLGEDGFGMRVVASSGSEADPTPFAQRTFAPALDLRDWDELRLWLRSSREGDGSPARPFYLAFEADTDPPSGAPWARLIPVQRRDAWELHSLWLDDVPPALRQSVGILRLRSLDPTIAFEADLDDLIAVTPDALRDVEATLVARLDERFQVKSNGGTVAVPAGVGPPPVGPETPYIEITPWSVTSLGVTGGSRALVDNYTAAGAFVRPPPFSAQVEYRIEVLAGQRDYVTLVLEMILAEFHQRGYLVVNNQQLSVTFFAPSSVERANLIPPGRTPLFCRLVCQVEAGRRELRPLAVPYLLVGPRDGRGTAEVGVV